MELCSEVVRLRGIADEKRSEYSDFTQLSFGQHKGRKLADVPNEYLEWWLRQHPDREIIRLETEYGAWGQRAIAKQNLKLYDYVQKRLNNDNTQGDEVR
jgi:hypothetical protein